MNTFSRSLIAFAIVLCVSIVIPSYVRAQTAELPLRVAPARQEIVLDPGQSSAVTIKFYNLGSSPVTGIVRAADFIVQDNEGTPTIVESALQASPKYSASGWVSLPYDQMSIAAQESVTIQARIQVPSDARPGGRYLALYFEPTPISPQTQPTVKSSFVTGRIAGLVYIRVSGEVTEKALVSRIYAPSFQEYGPIRIEADVINQGDYHIRPQGSVSVRNMFGGFVDQKRVSQENIFPDALRTFDSEVGRKWMFGRYTVEFLAAYGNTGQVVKRSVAVWVLPWKIILTLVLTLVLIIILSKKTYSKLIYRQKKLESQLRTEHNELEKLKEQISKK